jgi:hypothetical protein
MQVKRRPTGVTVIAVLQFITAGLFIVDGLIVMVRMSAVSRAEAGTPEMQSSPLGLVLGTIFGLGAVAFVAGIVCVAVGRGVWRLKNWARIVTLIACGPAAALLLYAFVVSVFLRSTALVALRNAVLLSACAFVIWYLMQPDVKRVFAPAAVEIPSNRHD